MAKRKFSTVRKVGGAIDVGVAERPGRGRVGVGGVVSPIASAKRRMCSRPTS
jgi:hypothetical protein